MNRFSYLCGMPKPIRRKDRENRDFLRRFFASKRGQDILKEQDVPVGDINLLPEAEVVGTPTQYEEADLAKAGLLAIREGAGMAPIVGEALDVAEFNKIRETGKDFYGDEADPTVYAGVTAGGLLLPNIIERPARAVGRAAKRFFKFGGDKLSNSDTLQTINKLRPSQKVKAKAADKREAAEALANPTPKDVDQAILRRDISNPYDRETHLKAMQNLGGYFTPNRRSGSVGQFREQSPFYRYANWLALREPELMKRVAAGDKTAIDRVLQDKKLADGFFNETQTTYRGVGAPKDADFIEEALINPKPGFGAERAYGEGVYTTAYPGKAMTYTDGGRGSVGILQTDMEYTTPMNLLDQLQKSTQTQGYVGNLRAGQYLTPDRIYGLGGGADVRVYNQFERLGKGRQPAKLKVLDVLSYDEAAEKVKELNKLGIDGQFWGSKTFDPSKLNREYLEAMRGGEGFVTAQKELKALNASEVAKLERIAKLYDVAGGVVAAAELGISVSPVTMAIVRAMEAPAKNQLASNENEKSQGGMISMKKKPTGMSAIRK